MIDVITIKASTNLIELAKLHTTLKPKGRPDHAKEWEGPCPKCGGVNRFYVQKEFFGCRGCHEKRGDAIEFIQWLEGLPFQEACQRLSGGDLPTTDHPTRHDLAPEPLEPPGEVWQARARELVETCQAALWADPAPKALAWLMESRGLSEGMIAAAGLGYNDHDHHDEYGAWGLEADPAGRGVWLPRGVTIPWEIGGELWRVNIRRPALPGDKFKYFSPKGCSNGLYGADLVKPGKPVVLVEGELDALTIEQHAGDLVNGVATGSTCGARLVRWIGRLALVPVVLVAYDNEPDKGEKAAAYWLDALPNARRWRPYWNDVNAMAQDGADVLAWIKAGLN